MDESERMAAVKEEIDNIARSAADTTLAFGMLLDVLRTNLLMVQFYLICDNVPMAMARLNAILRSLEK